MRRAIAMVVLALALTAAPVAAQTSFTDFFSGIQSFADTYGEPESPVAIKEAAERSRVLVLSHLLSVDPDPCYEDAYVALWRLYTDLHHMGVTDVFSEEWGAIQRLTAVDLEDMFDALRETDCG